MSSPVALTTPKTLTTGKSRGKRAAPAAFDNGDDDEEDTKASPTKKARVAGPRAPRTPATGKASAKKAGAGGKKIKMDDAEGGEMDEGAAGANAGAGDSGIGADVIKMETDYET